MRWVLVVAMVGVVGCSSSQLPLSNVHIQRKNVVSRQPAPNLMLLTDRSASMGQPVDPACTSSCATRLNAVQGALSTVLGQKGAMAHFGLAVFPDSAGVCSASAAGLLQRVTGSSSSSDAELQAKASAVSADLDAVAIAGVDHPIAAALASVGGLAELNDMMDHRQDFVLLVTAGVPDCGSADALQAVQALRQRGIDTIVVGFGPDTASAMVGATLDALAEAGGFARTCPNGLDSDCGPDNRCLAGNVCEHKRYQAATQAELTGALTEMMTPLPSVSPCQMPLEVKPASPDGVTVLINGTVVEPGPGTWTLGSDDVVSFQDGLCDYLERATPMDPVAVEFRVLEL